MLGPTVGVFLVLWILVRVAVGVIHFSETSFWEVFLGKDLEFLSHLEQLPEVCISQKKINDFQSHQCDDYWDRFCQSIALIVVPFVGAGAFAGFMIILFLSVYKKTKEKVQSQKGDCLGVVMRHLKVPQVKASQDFFSWFFCLKPVMVQVQHPNKKQIKVYFSSDFKSPQPGASVALFDLGVIWQKSRFVGVSYTPHVAIFKGVR
jgi:hypothetical protein